MSDRDDYDDVFYSDVKVLLITTTQLTTNVNKQLVLGLNDGKSQFDSAY